MLASAFGIPGQHITRKDEVEAALDTMLASEGVPASRLNRRAKMSWPLVPRRQ